MHANGFTILEVIVVIALLGMIGASSAPVFMSTYQHASLRAERVSLVATLQHARAEAMNDECTGMHCDGGADYGVLIRPDRYVLFQGTGYETRDAAQDDEIAADQAFAHTGIAEIVFASTTGNALDTGTTTIVDAYGRTASITINSSGEIDWNQ